MKKIILIGAILLQINSVMAQTNTATGSGTNTGSVNTPQTVTNRFNTDYPNMNATWTRDGDYYRAEYMDNQSNMSRAVVYDRDGNTVYNEELMADNSYPESIGTYYKENYPNESSFKVWS